MPPGSPSSVRSSGDAAHVTPHLSINVRRQQTMVEQTAANTVIVAIVNFLATPQ